MMIRADVEATVHWMNELAARVRAKDKREGAHAS